MNLNEIESAIIEIASRLSVDPVLLPTFGYSEESGRPHIEVTSDRLCYIVRERGHEFSRTCFNSLEDLLFITFKNITLDIAGSYEVRNRIKTQDSRRLIFAKQLDLMDMLNPLWKSKLIEDHNKILSTHPFDDRIR